MAAAGATQPLFSMEQEYSVLDPFTGLPPGVFAAGGIPIYIPGRGGHNHHNQQQQQQQQQASHYRARHHPQCGCFECAYAAAAAAAAAAGSPPLNHSPASDASCGGALAASLAAALPAMGLGGGADGSLSAAAARLLLQAQSLPPPPRGSPAARHARQLAELHMRACLKAGLRYAGAAAPSSTATAAAEAWAYTIGPCGGVEVSDQICVSRFLLRRLADELGSVNISFSSSSGSGGLGNVNANLCCAAEFSTAGSRAPGEGIGEMQRVISRLQAAHPAHAPGFAGAPPSAHNKQSSVCAPPAPFSVAVGDRRASVVIPSSTLVARAGPFSDRRAAADCDPYLVTTLIAAGGLALPLPRAAARAVLARRAAAEAAAAAAGFLAASSAAPGGGLPQFQSAFGVKAYQPAFPAAAFPAAVATAALSCAAGSCAQPDARPSAADGPQPSGSAVASGGGCCFSACTTADGATTGRRKSDYQGATSAFVIAAAHADGDDCHDEYDRCCAFDASYDSDDCIRDEDDEAAGSEEEDSQDMLVTEIRRMDRRSRRRGAGAGGHAAAALAPRSQPMKVAAAGSLSARFCGDSADLFYDDEDDLDDYEEGEEDDSASSGPATPAGTPYGSAPRLVGGALDCEMAAAC
jgi:hypothetical protein